MTNLKKTTTLGLAGALIATVLASTAWAQDSRPGRYTMHKSDDGFVRLDTETGAVALCQKSGTQWRCSRMDDGTTASTTSGTDEAGRLKRENAELKAEIKRLDELLGLRSSRKEVAKQKPNFRLPTEKEVDTALNYFERMLKKFQERLKRLEKNSEPAAPERQL